MIDESPEDWLEHVDDDEDSECCLDDLLLFNRELVDLGDTGETGVDLVSCTVGCAIRFKLEKFFNFFKQKIRKNS